MSAAQSAPRLARGSLLALSAFILAWPLAAYPALLWLIARLRGRAAPSETLAADGDSGVLPTLAVVVPTYRERANIAARLQNLAECDYPRDGLEVIVVDSASGDGTAEAAEAFASHNGPLRVRVLREEKRAGKAAAINYALANTTSELILVTDAPTRFASDALTLIAGRFRDPNVGAATGQFEVFEERTATQREEGIFWRIRNLLRKLEADVDSTPFLSGELCCFRRDVVRHIDTDSIADDMNVALRARRAGYRAVVDTRVLFTEPRAGELGDLLVRKVSRAAGGIQELLRNRDLIFNRRYGVYGMLILPSDLFYYLPLRVPALAVMAAALMPSARRHRAMLALIAGGALAVPAVRRRVLDGAYVMLLNEWLFVRGWQTVLTGRTEVLWSQESRSVVPDAAWVRGAADDGEKAERKHA